MLTDLTYEALEFICLRMRAQDREEIYGMRSYDNPLQLAMEAHAYIKNNGRARIAWYKGKPCACAAMSEDWPGVWSIWMFGTDDFKNGAIELLRWFRKEANDILTICHGHRIQCDSMSTYTEAHKMIEAMGGRKEHVFRHYGRAYEDGREPADYIRFVWLKERDSAILNPHYKRAV
jgi:hypothetical protein